jgi:hypothetical protein
MLWFECGLDSDSTGSANPIPKELKLFTSRKNSCFDELDLFSGPDLELGGPTFKSQNKI